MVLLDVTTGLRRSELFALKWLISTSLISLSIFDVPFIGPCKTEASRKPVPLDLNVAADLWLWKEESKFARPEDWIFASPRTGGQQPLWPNTILQKTVRPAALRVGIRKTIGWHTFRHTYSTLLIAQGENVKLSRS
jgi:integrase